MTTGPEEVEAKFAKLDNPNLTVKEAKEIAAFLYGEYKWMLRCFTVATEPVAPTRWRNTSGEMSEEDLQLCLKEVMPPTKKSKR